VIAVRKAVSAATTIFTAISIRRFFFIISFLHFSFTFLISHFSFNFVDFCHDSAIHASMIALAAPKVLIWQRPEALSPWPSA
jgi:hypothetical protein